MPRLYEAVQIGDLPLSHRVVLAPLTRMRAEVPGNVPGAAMSEYYAQRATTGGLLISEATFVTRRGNGGYASPGIETSAQVAGWRGVVDAVHAKGGVFFLQLWHVGRASHSDLQPDGGQPVAPSAIDAGVRALLKSGPGAATPPRELALNEIPSVIADYVAASERAKQAGFDGIEIHAANGYLIDQFLQTGSNHRQDAYGGSIPNRMRLLLEIVDAVTKVWGAGRVGVRIGPSNTFNGMHDEDPTALFAAVARELGRRGIAYLHVIEPRVAGNMETGDQSARAAGAMKARFGGPVIAAGGFDREGAEAIVEQGAADLVAFGRHFIANPDLPHRLRHVLPLNPYDRSTFYYGGLSGYTDYPEVTNIDGSPEPASR